jgi:thioesterase domain-containing protein
MGLDSLRGLQLLSGIEASLSVKLPQRVLMEYPTIEALSRHVFTLLRPDAEPRVRVDDPVQQEINRGTLVRLRGEGSRRAFFFAPPLHGSGYAFGSIAQHLGSDQPFYSFNAPGVETDRPPCDRIVPIAAGFIEALRVVQPRGPYRIGGYSFGALVAYDMTLKLRQAGEEVEMLVIGDLPALWRANNVISPLLQMARIFNLPIDEPNFQSASLDEQIANTALAIGQVAMLPAGMGESIKQIRVFRAHLHAMHAYHVESCDAPMTLLRAHDTRNGIERVGISAQDPSLGWDAFCTRKVNIRDVPGNHLNAIFLPSAIEFARVLDDVLRQLDTP